MKLDIDFLKSDLRQQVTEKRYIHSLGVAETAKSLAEKYHEDKDKAEIAGILHDMAKYWPEEKLKSYIQGNKNLFGDLIHYNKELWHGPVASIYIQEKYEIKDKDIIHAVRYHTSGRENMSTLEKIVCLADYIEPSRNFPGVEEIRLITKESLEMGLVAALDSTIKYLISKMEKIYPLTIQSRNFLISEMIRNEGGN